MLRLWMGFSAACVSPQLRKIGHGPVLTIGAGSGSRKVKGLTDDPAENQNPLFREALPEVKILDGV
jgi:hypothetical protein